MRFLQLPAFLAAYLAVRDSQPVFNPRVYERQSATCQAFNRNEGRNMDLDIRTPPRFDFCISKFSM
jgi:hypothetical protein